MVTEFAKMTEKSHPTYFAVPRSIPFWRVLGNTCQRLKCTNSQEASSPTSQTLS